MTTLYFLWDENTHIRRRIIVRVWYLRHDYIVLLMRRKHTYEGYHPRVLSSVMTILHFWWDENGHIRRSIIVRGWYLPSWLRCTFDGTKTHTYEEWYHPRVVSSVMAITAITFFTCVWDKIHTHIHYTTEWNAAAASYMCTRHEFRKFVHLFCWIIFFMFILHRNFASRFRFRQDRKTMAVINHFSISTLYGTKTHTYTQWYGGKIWYFLYISYFNTRHEFRKLVCSYAVHTPKYFVCVNTEIMSLILVSVRAAMISYRFKRYIDRFERYIVPFRTIYRTVQIVSWSHRKHSVLR